jgi:uncharacterized protein YndB with AHSA1/START domain
MPDITITKPTPAAPADVWAVLGDLAAADTWVPGVVSAVVDGDRRVCRMGDGSDVEEQFLEISAETRTVAVRHVRHPAPIENSTVAFSVAAAEDGSVITCRASLQGPDQLLGMFEQGYAAAVDSLSQRALDVARA